MGHQPPDQLIVELPRLGQLLQRDPLRVQIADRLHALVDARLLRPGDDLPGERDLAEILDVSRESIRGAIQILAARGVLEVAHGSRSRITNQPRRRAEASPRCLDAFDDDAVVAARRVLEPALAAAAATRLDSTALRRLDALVAAQRGMLLDPVRFQISDGEFHDLIFAAGGNPVLLTYARETYSHAYAQRRDVMVHDDGIARALSDHEAILRALQARDESAAAAAMTAHIDMIRDLLRAKRTATPKQKTPTGERPCRRGSLDVTPCSVPAQHSPHPRSCTPRPRPPRCAARPSS